MMTAVDGNAAREGCLVLDDDVGWGIDDDLLFALEESLTDSTAEDSVAKRKQCNSSLDTVPLPSKRRAMPATISADVYPCKEHWISEVGLDIALFLPWYDLVQCARLSCVWRNLEKEESLWEAHFYAKWPRLARRTHVKTDQVVPWRMLFRFNWSKADRAADALEEDWLDFTAARELQSQSTEETAEVSSLELTVQHASQRCAEELSQFHGIQIPTEPDWGHTCTATCRYHRLHLDGDAFICEASGLVHVCRPHHACDISLATNDGFLVCPVSGHCVPKPHKPVVDAVPEVWNDWEPDLGGAQQFAYWFETGYHMSEDQARKLFNERSMGKTFPFRRQY